MKVHVTLEEKHLHKDGNGNLLYIIDCDPMWVNHTVTPLNKTKTSTGIRLCVPMVEPSVEFFSAMVDFSKKCSEVNMVVHKLTGEVGFWGVSK